jgi:hypothetical protein
MILLSSLHHLVSGEWWLGGEWREWLGDQQYGGISERSEGMTTSRVQPHPSAETSSVVPISCCASDGLSAITVGNTSADYALIVIYSV